jgi:hypothetical protein
MRTRQIVDSTRARDESIWACHLEPVFGAIPLAKLRRSDIAAWVVDLVDADLAPTTVTRCVAALKKALTDAVAEGLITASPAAGVKPPRPDQIERRFLTLEASHSEVRPRHAGRFLAERIANREGQLDESLATLGALGARLHDGPARRRYAEQAGRGLAAAGLGPDGWLERAITGRMVLRPQDLDCSARMATWATMMHP